MKQKTMFPTLALGLEEDIRNSNPWGVERGYMICQRCAAGHLSLF